MASSWLLQTIYAALIGQTTFSGNQSPSTDQGPAATYRPLVSTAYGSLQGVRTTTSSGISVDHFLGVPFATPPVGRLRFQKPLPSTKWSGVRDASKFGNVCQQRPLDNPRVSVAKDYQIMTEDCLYLNIYKPIVTTTSSLDLLPVMGWIHGGGYYVGAGSQFDGSELASNGVIVVTINYRLDIFGYLSNEDDIIPGNYGMLDQILALKWVKSNIQSFGGDASQVTIFGQSAGSGSVSLLILSPLATGLFSRAIMESGTSLSPWAMHVPASRVSPIEFLNQVGLAINCDLPTAKENLLCLRNVDTETLLNASLSVQKTLGGGMILNPVVEKTFGFLPDLPLKMWIQNNFTHVDTIRGYNTAEYGWFAMNATRPYSKQLFIRNIKDDIFLQYVLADDDKLISDMVQKYVGNETNEQNILMDFVYAATDIYFGGPALIETNFEMKYASEKNHYVYEFAHKPSLSAYPKWMPPIHGEELRFVFGAKLFKQPEESESLEDRMVARQMQTMWTTFAKFGKPIQNVQNGALQWRKYDPNTAMVLRIGKSSQMLSFRNHSSMDIFPKLLQRLYTTFTDDFIIG